MKKLFAPLPLLLGCCVATLAFALLWPDGDAALDETEVSSEKSPASLPGSERPGEANFEPAPSEEEASPSEDESPLLLGRECPEVLGEEVRTDEDCLDAVEEHFMDRPAYVVQHLGMAPRDAPFTFREMLESAEEDRRLVTEALSHPECRLLEGPIRPDLGEFCNAEAFYRYGLLTELCNEAEGMRNYFVVDDTFFLSEDERIRAENAWLQYEIEMEQHENAVKAKLREFFSDADVHDLARRLEDPELRSEINIFDLWPKDGDWQEEMDALEPERPNYPPLDVPMTRYESDLIDAEMWGGDPISPPASIRQEWDDERGWYYSWRNRYRKEALRAVWLDARGMCPSHVFETSPPVPEGVSPDPDLLANWDGSWEENHPNEPRHAHLPNVSPTKHSLLEIAVRLGDERLIAERGFRLEPKRDEEFHRSKAELFPWTRNLNIDTIDDWVSFDERFRRVARGFVELRNAGYETDAEEIVRVLCKISPEQIPRSRLPDCASAIAEAENGLDYDALRMLDEIKAKLIEMRGSQY